MNLPIVNGVPINGWKVEWRSGERKAERYYQRNGKDVDVNHR